MTLVSSVEALVEVDYGQFFVTSGTSDGDPAPMYSGTEDFLELNEGCALCISAWNRHHATIRMEYWSVPPPPLVDWEREQSFVLRRGAGPAYAVALQGRLACELDLDIAEGDPVQTRIACRGRQAVWDLASGPEYVSPSGVEVWLAQFWPSPDAGE